MPDPAVSLTVGRVPHNFTSTTSSYPVGFDIDSVNLAVEAAERHLKFLVES